MKGVRNMPEIELVDASSLHRWERILRATMLVALGSLLAASVVIVVRPTLGNAPAPYAYVAPQPSSLPALPLRLPLVEVSPEVLAGLKVARAESRKAERRSERRSERRDQRKQREQKSGATTDATTDVRDAGNGSTATVSVQPSPGASPSPVSGPREPEPAPAPVPAPQPVSTESHRLKEVVDPVETSVKKAVADAAPAAAPVVDAVFSTTDGLLRQADAAAPAQES